MTNSLGLLQHAREVLKLNWDWQTAASAAELGNLEMLAYCYAHDCEIDERVCTLAAVYGQLNCLKYLHETVRARWSKDTRIGALIEFLEGNDACLECFQYARRNGCPRHESEDEIGVSDDEDEGWYEYWRNDCRD